MFNIGAGEIAVILIAALVVLGPDRLPELARTIGKFLREFRRHTDEVRGVVLREFYKMEQSVEPGPVAPKPQPEPAPAPEPKPIEVTSGDQKIAILPASGAVARVAKPPAPPPPPPEPPTDEGEVTEVDTLKEAGS